MFFVRNYTNKFVGSYIYIKLCFHSLIAELVLEIKMQRTMALLVKEKHRLSSKTIVLQTNKQN